MLNFRSAAVARRALTVATLPLCLYASATRVGAQGNGNPSGNVPTVQLPPVQVTAQKEPADANGVPVSVTPVNRQTIADAGLETVSDAGAYAPNAHFTDFSARKLSNARFRGIGASPSNPAITTYFDGVPQLNSNSANVDLLDVDQIEFVRGPQSTLWGRNTLGGVINVTTHRPTLGGRWTGDLFVPFANQDEKGIRGVASGPIVGEKLAAGVAFNYLTRDGYTTNLVTGHTLDDREGFSAKGQALWKPSKTFEARVIVSGERARDGDYALSDVGGLRANPFQAAHDFEGFTNRDIVSTTVLTRWDSKQFSLTTATGFVDWSTEDSTDLDYLPLPLATRHNKEESLQFTQEVRFANSAAAPIRLGTSATLSWQGGLFLFTQNYDQDATNSYSALLISQQFGVPLSFAFPVTEQSPLASLDDVGVGVYGHGTVTLGDKLDLIAGVRGDHENKKANIGTGTTPPVTVPTVIDDERDFSDVSPRFAAAYRMHPNHTVYGLVSRGFKAGGFNASPLGVNTTYAQEHTWNVEGGVKGLWANGRVMTSASVFRIDWQDLQLNLPNLSVPGQFYIANAGSAVSSGFEVEGTGRVIPGIDVFGSLGYTHARFGDGVLIGATNVGGNEIPNTPDFTSTIGTQITNQLGKGVDLYGRAEVLVQGAFQYDEANTQGQDTYALTNFRVGVRFGVVVAETWVQNAFDTKYIPVAFEYRAFAPSGFIGEMGRPRTFGVNLGVKF
jgi:iron complex outermembrane receptor protein